MANILRKNTYSKYELLENEVLKDEEYETFNSINAIKDIERCSIQTENYQKKDIEILSIERIIREFKENPRYKYLAVVTFLVYLIVIITLIRYK